jgi:DNA topoisomerase-1
VPLAKRIANKKSTSPIVAKLPPTLTNGSSSSDSDVPLAAAKASKAKAEVMEAAAKEAKELRAKEKNAVASKKRKSAARAEERARAEESDSDVPLTKKRATAPKINGVKKEVVLSNNNKSLVKKAAAAPAKRAPAAKKEPPVKREAKGKSRANKSETPSATPADAEEGEDEEEYKWWENQAETDGTKKWTTLEHNGVLFPPLYEPLPKDVKMRYDGVPITLSLDAEEVAGFFGAMLETPHAAIAKFRENFFNDFQEIVKETGGAKDPNGKKTQIKSFDKCDFTPMFNYYEAKKAEKKAFTAAQKKQARVDKEEAEKTYTYCLLDGRREKVGNFRIEPPGLFRGRGDHPKTGKVKKRVLPEQVTLNIGADASVPPPPEGHKWGGIQHDDRVTWLATWKENINGNIKYVMLAATSSLKGMSDHKKFEKARELKVCTSVSPGKFEVVANQSSETYRPHTCGLHSRAQVRSHGRPAACDRHVPHRSISSQSW